MLKEKEDAKEKERCEREEKKQQAELERLEKKRKQMEEAQTKSEQVNPHPTKIQKTSLEPAGKSILSFFKQGPSTKQVLSQEGKISPHQS